VKEEDKTLLTPGPPGKEEGPREGSSKDGSGPSRDPQPPSSPIPSETSQRAKSAVPTLAMNGLGTALAEGPREEAQGLSRKRVANAVRKVVSKVLPGEEPGSAREPLSRGVRSPDHPPQGKRGEETAPGPKPPPPPPPPAPPKPEIKKEAAKDELSAGLRSLMSRGRGKDHKPRGRQSSGKAEKPSSLEPGSPEVVGSPAKPEPPEKQCSPAPAEELEDPGSAGVKSDLTGSQQCKAPASGGQQEVPECVTNLSCPSPPLLEGQAPSQLASPSLFNKPAWCRSWAPAMCR
ncbi:hypothetical protein MC885_003224, partial [Smutsia gigantea]